MQYYIHNQRILNIKQKGMKWKLGPFACLWQADPCQRGLLEDFCIINWGI